MSPEQYQELLEIQIALSEHSVRITEISKALRSSWRSLKLTPTVCHELNRGLMVAEKRISDAWKEIQPTIDELKEQLFEKEIGDFDSELQEAIAILKNTIDPPIDGT